MHSLHSCRQASAFVICSCEIDVSSKNLLDDNTVGWHWQWDVSDYDTKKQEDHDSGSQLKVEAQNEESSGDTEQESTRDDDMFSLSLATHSYV